MSNKIIKWIPQVLFHSDHRTTSISAKSDEYRFTQGSYFIDDDTLVSEDLYTDVQTTNRTYTHFNNINKMPILTEKIKLVGDSSTFRRVDEATSELPLFIDWVEARVVPGRYKNHYCEISLPVNDADEIATNFIESEFFYNYEFVEYERLSNAAGSNFVETCHPSHLLFHYSITSETQFGLQNTFLQSVIRSYPVGAESTTSDGNGARGFRTGSNGAVVSTARQLPDMYPYGQTSHYVLSLPPQEPPIVDNKYLFDVTAPQGDLYDGKSPELKNLNINFFNSFNSTVSDSDSNIDLQAYSLKFRNVFVLYDGYDANAQVEYLPHYFSLSMPSLNQGTMLMDLKREINQNSMERPILAYIKRVDPEPWMSKISNGVSDTFEPLSINTWKLGPLGLLNSNAVDIEGTANETLVDERPNEAFLFSEEDIRLSMPEVQSDREDNMTNFKIAIKQTIKDYMDDLSDQNPFCFRSNVINCSPSPSRVIGYKIEKHRRPNAPAYDATPIQTFYVPITTGDEQDPPFMLTDTQIRYDSKYYYSFKALTVVIGRTYDYENLVIDNDNYTAEFDFIAKASVLLAEIPIESSLERAIVPPPFPPTVYPCHKKYTSNYVKFYLTDNFGNYVSDRDISEYTIIKTEDGTYDNKLSQSSKRVDRMYDYSSRAHSGVFEIFKIDFRPTSYSDFRDGYVGTTVPISSTDLDQSSTGVFVDYIPHEKKYYYLFRAVTPHGNASNPSFIYEMELLEDADEVILNYTSFDIEPPRPTFDNSVSFRKFLQLIVESDQASIEQEQFAADTSTAQNYSNSLILGPWPDGQDESVWSMQSSNLDDTNYKFMKLRLTSKQTGKKIDINLTFKLEPDN